MRYNLPVRAAAAGLELASFILTTMEGGVMQARMHRSPATYDAAVHQLRGYLSHLEAAASARKRKAS